MLSRINKYIIFVLLVSLGAYVVYLNGQHITLVIPPSTTISANAGVIYLGIFFAGMLCAGLVSLFFGIKAYWRERALKNRDRQHSEFLKGILKARASMSCGEWRKAADIWQGLIRKDQSNIVARLELSRALELGGELREALKIVDEARAVDPHNSETLFRAAELNLALKNKTAAVDNLALILYHEPNLRAAEMARDLSEELERYADALEYQAKLESFGANADAARAERGRIKFKQILAETASDQDALERQLKDLLKTNSDCAPALSKLASIEKTRGQIDRAAELYVRAAKSTQSEQYWLEAAKLWMGHGMPERAVSAARSATRETRGKERILAELNLIRIYLAFAMLDEAKKSLDNLKSLCQAETVEADTDMQRKFLLLRGLYENLRGDNKRATEILEHLADDELHYELSSSGTTHTYSNAAAASPAKKAPSPSLSTP